MTPRPERIVAIEVDEIVVHGVAIADPAAFGDLVHRHLGGLVERRHQDPADANGLVHVVQMSTPDDLDSLARGVAASIWSQAQLPGGQR
jgi:hypothetical protein